MVCIMLWASQEGPSLALPLSLCLSMSLYPPPPPCMQSELLQVFQAFLQARVSSGDWQKCIFYHLSLKKLEYTQKSAFFSGLKSLIHLWRFISLTPFTTLPAPQPQNPA